MGYSRTQSTMDSQAKALKDAGYNVFCSNKINNEIIEIEIAEHVPFPVAEKIGTIENYESDSPCKGATTIWYKKGK